LAGTVLGRVAASDPEGTAITYTLSNQLSYIDVEANGDIVLVENGPKVYNYPLSGTTLTLTATDASGVSTTVNVVITNREACGSSPCLHLSATGTCRNCIFSYPAITTTQRNTLYTTFTNIQCTTSALLQNAVIGFSCSACGTGWTGLRCELSRSAYFVSTELALNPALYDELVLVNNKQVTSKPTLTSTQINAIRSSYYSAAGLASAPDKFKSYSNANLTISMVIPEGSETGAYVLVLTRYSAYGATLAEVAGEFSFSFSYKMSQTNAIRTTAATALASSSTFNAVAGPEASSSSASSSALTAILVSLGVVALIVLVVVLVLRRRQSRQVVFDKDFESVGTTSYTSHAINPSFQLPAKAEPQYDAPVAESFEQGMNNGMYSWYQPEMSRKDCTEYLESQGEGAFVIRDSAATPGWHMLAVKTSSEVVHEKIRYTEDGQYELLTNDETEQPRFPDLPALVEYYLVPQSESPYTLARPTAQAADSRPQGSYGYLYIEPTQSA
jgi:hypothetical protein